MAVCSHLQDWYEGLDLPTWETGLGFTAEEEFASMGVLEAADWERSKVLAVSCWVAWEGGNGGGY